MASMNKPASDSTSWHTSVIDNFTSIESNLIDQSLVTAKGDMLAATGSGAPARLAAGSWGDYLVADSTQSTGMRWGGCNKANAYLQKHFFAANGMLPANIIREDLLTWPTADFSNANGGTFATSMSRLRYTPSSSPATYGWDMGAQKGKALFIMGMTRPMSSAQGIYLSTTTPTTGPSDGYMFLLSPADAKAEIYRGPVGSFGLFDRVSETKAIASNSYANSSFDLALYVDCSIARITAFLRVGSEVWWPVIDFTDPDPWRVTTVRYAGVYFAATTNHMWAGCPLGIYAE